MSASLAVFVGFFACLTARGGGFPVAWGTSDPYGLTNPPVSVSNIIAIASGAYHTIVVNEDGTVSGWGENLFGKASSPVGLNNVTAIAAGGQHNLALRKNGRVVAWGDNSALQTNVPPSVTNAFAIAAGDAHSLAVKSNGTVVAWGANNSGQATPPVGLASVVAVAAGGNHSLALRTDGTVVAWGQNTFGQSTVPAGLNSVIAIAAGSDFSVALRANGSIVAWGNSAQGRLSVPTGVTVIGIAAGTAHGLALLNNRTVVGWGSNFSGQTAVPSNLNNVMAVSAGAGHSVALRWRPPRFVVQPQSQTVLQGDNVTFSPTITGSTPLQFRWRKAGTDIPGATNLSLTIPNVQAADAGTYTLLLSNAVGTVLSSNAILAVNVPAAITQQPQSLEVTEGTPLTLTVTATGSSPLTYRWQKGGVTIFGAVSSSYIISNPTPQDSGDYTVVVSNSFNSVTSDIAVVTVHALPKIVTEPQSQTVLPGSSATFSVAATDATGYQWKKNGTNILGANATIFTINNSQAADAGTYTVEVSNAYGSITSHPATLTVSTSQGDPSALVLWGEDPVWTGMDYVDMTPLPSGLNNIAAIAAGAYHQLVLFNNGTVLGWGDNFYGQAGSPPNATNLAAISAGVHHSLGLMRSGRVIGWGHSTYGQIAIPVSASNAIAIAAGGNHSLALKPSGKVLAWGLNLDGQATVPVTVSNAVAIAAGLNHSLAVVAGGRVLGWGNNDYGQRRPPNNLSNVIALAAGHTHSVALKSDGTVVAWGNNNFNQLNVPAGLNEVVAISAGANHTLALRRNGSLVGWGQNNFGQIDPPPGLPQVIAIAAGGARSLALKGKLLRLLPPQSLGSNRFRLRIANADGAPFDPTRVSRISIYYSANPTAPRSSWTKLNVALSIVGNYLQGDDNSGGATRFYFAQEGP